LERLVQRKDEEIRRLEANKKGATAASSTQRDKNNELRNKIAYLEAELKREKERVDIKQANKKLLELQEMCSQKQKQLDKQKKSIEEYKVKMVEFMS